MHVSFKPQNNHLTDQSLIRCAMPWKSSNCSQRALKAHNCSLADGQRGKVMWSKARRDLVRQLKYGKARQSEARRGKARQGEASQNEIMVSNNYSQLHTRAKNESKLTDAVNWWPEASLRIPYQHSLILPDLHTYHYLFYIVLSSDQSRWSGCHSFYDLRSCLSVCLN